MFTATKRFLLLFAGALITNCSSDSTTSAEAPPVSSSTPAPSASSEPITPDAGNRNDDSFHCGEVQPITVQLAGGRKITVYVPIPCDPKPYYDVSDPAPILKDSLSR